MWKRLLYRIGRLYLASLIEAGHTSGLTVFDLGVSSVSNGINSINTEAFPRGIGCFSQQPQVTDFVVDLLLYNPSSGQSLLAAMRGRFVLGINNDLYTVSQRIACRR